MFGWIGRKNRRVNAVALLIAEGENPHRIFGELPANERDSAFNAAVTELLSEERLDGAVAVTEARLEVGPETAASLLLADTVFGATGDFARCAAICEQLVILSNEAVIHMTRLANRLVAAGAPDQALEILDMIPPSETNWLESAETRAETLVALERPTEALRVLTDLLAHDERAMRSALNSFSWQAARNRAARVRPLHDELIAETEGAEQVVVAALRSGRLDPHAAVNFRLLANSLMVDSAYVPPSVRLEDPYTALAAGYDARDAWAVARFGAATLRTGSVREAQRLFEQAREIDGRCFAAYRGLAGVGSVRRTRTFDRVHALPKPPVPIGIERVVSDWNALTDVEQRIVVASMHPLRSVLASLYDAEASVVLLPIDVRTVDLPALGVHSNDSFDDHRSFAALGGVASSVERLAMSRIEDLLGFGDAGGLVFAHEFAHLAYYCMPEDNPFRELHDEAFRSPHVGTPYELSNADEFFAGAYESYVARLWDLPNDRVEDDTGIYAEVFAWFDEIARHD